MPTPTWGDIQLRALFDPVIAAMCAMVESGQATPEQALIATVLWLSDDREARVAADVERRANAPRIIRAWPK